MSEILEIRDGCQTPLELLTSQTFNKYLDIYKRKFLSELKSRQQSEQKDEILHKKDFVEQVYPDIFIEIFKSENISDAKLSIYKEYIRFLEGLFHHFRKKSYTRLIKLHNEILSSNESAESIKDRISKRASELNDLVLETRRIFLSKVDMGIGVRRSQGLECQPNVTCGEISGDNINYPNLIQI